MNWIELSNQDQLNEIREKSFLKPQVIFKHSTRCSISSMALNRLERENTPDSMDFYYLDLLKNRALSNEVGEFFNVFHESPQILLIKNGVCTYDESHHGINMHEIIEQASL